MLIYSACNSVLYGCKCIATCIVSVMKWLHPIMEYGSTPYVGWHGKKVASPNNAYDSCHNSALIIVIGFYECFHQH